MGAYFRRHWEGSAHLGEAGAQKLGSLSTIPELQTLPGTVTHPSLNYLEQEVRTREGKGNVLLGCAKCSLDASSWTKTASSTGAAGLDQLWELL